MHNVPVDAYVLPWGDIADTSLRGQPSLLRMLVKGRHPTAVYDTIAGGCLLLYMSCVFGAYQTRCRTCCDSLCVECMQKPITTARMLLDL
jgi:hypothetical protein